MLAIIIRCLTRAASKPRKGRGVVNWGKLRRPRSKAVTAAVVGAVSLPAFAACVAYASDPWHRVYPPHHHGHHAPHNVPEPATMALLAGAAAALITIRRGRRQSLTEYPATA